MRELAHQRAFVRSLAEQLLRDAASADDVAQDACRIAIQQPPAEAGRGWWRTVTRTLVAREHRRRARQHRREVQAAVRAETSVPETAHVVAEMEWARRLSDAVLRLDEPLREAVMLRFWRGWSARRIAERQGVTSRSIERRLQRAYDALRGELDGPDGTRRAAWVLGLGSLVSLREPALSSAISWWTGAVVMKSASGVLGVVLVLSGVAWWWNERAEAEVVSVSTPAESVGTSAPEPRPGGVMREPLPAQELTHPGESGPTVEPNATDDPPPRVSPDEWRELTPPGVLAGVVLRGTQLVPEGTVWILHGETYSSLERPWRKGEAVQSADLVDGRFRFDGLETGSYVVGVQTPNGLLRELEWAVHDREQGRSMVIVLGTSVIEGTVYDVDGAPLAGAMVSLGLSVAKETPFKADTFHLFQRTDAHGAYRLEDVPAGTYWWSAEFGGKYQVWYSAEYITYRVSVGVGETLRRDHGDAMPASRVEGVLVNEAGSVVPGPGTLYVKPDTGGYTEMLLEDDGTFSARLLPGTYKVSGRLSLGEVVITDEWVVEAGTVQARLTLPGMRLVGQVEMADGSPWPPRPFAQRIVLTSVQEGVGLRRKVSVDEEGHFVCDGLTAGTWTVAGYPYTLADGDPAATLEVRGDLPEQSISLRLRIP